MPDFESSDSQRFSGDFRFAPTAGYTATAAEQAYVRCLESFLNRMAAEPAGPEGLAAELEVIRAHCCQELRTRARDFAEIPAGQNRDAAAEKELRQALRLDGMYLERRERALQIPFVVKTVPDNTHPITDLIIQTRDVPIPADKQRFKVELDRTLTVVKSVLAERQRSWFGAGGRGRSAINVNKLDEYLTALAGIARVGLMNLDKTQTPFAELALTGLKDEFVAREAGVVKNAYIQKLGVAAILALIACIIGYGILGRASIPDGYAAFRNFFLLWAGAAVGTWLSFSIRRVILTFSDLAVLEEDRMNPGFRILFMLALTTVIGLLFWTDMVTIQIGTFKTDFKAVGAGETAFLIGALCGIAERSMASAVAKRAEDFAAGVGRSGPVTR